MNCKYEKNLGLKTIYTTLVRRFYIIILIFLPISLTSFIVTNFLLTKTYISHVEIARGTTLTINNSHYATIQNQIRNTSSDPDKPGAIFTASQYLKEKGVKHSNGKEITINEISAGLSFDSFTNGSIKMGFSFQSKDESITKAVLDELALATVNNLKEYGGDYANMLVYGNGASMAKKNSKESTYFLISLAAGFVVACAVPFVYEIIADEVYDKEDVMMLGSESFELKVPSK